jgi:gamma-glutamylcyclotransferase (GGCT)/AIG2-like uncharacterized protein YtfP
LKPGLAGFEELGLKARVDVMGSDKIAGTLYDLGDYPGLILNGGGTVAGYLLRPHDEALLSLLDEYELYDELNPETSEYIRLIVRTIERGIEAWVYIYNKPINGRPTVNSGEWGSL